MQPHRYPFDRQLSLALDRLTLQLEARPRPLRRTFLKRRKNLLERRIPRSKVCCASR